MHTVATVGIISKPAVPNGKSFVQEVVGWLEDRGVNVQIDRQTAEYTGAPNPVPRTEMAQSCELIVVLGGDGTLLAAVRALGSRDIPLLPVNLGGLGFLTAVTMQEVYAELERALAGQARLTRRQLLRCELARGGATVACFEALNDVVLTKASIARIIDLEVYVDNNYVSNFKADGLIVSTPTGSTAYSLAAGGPIIFPRLEGFCITPICPHMLTHRPVVVPDTCEIRVVCHARENEGYLTIDGQVGQELHEQDTVICRKSERSVRLVRSPQYRFFDVLREKLKWGER